MPFWMRLLALGGFGALGAMARYLIALWVARTAPGSPWLGTLAANALGCLLFGLVVRALDDGGWLGPEAKILLLTGFLGAFTTFSAYAFDAIVLWETRSLALAGGYLLVQNAVGLAAVGLGMAMGAALAGRGF